MIKIIKYVLLCVQILLLSMSLKFIKKSSSVMFHCVNIYNFKTSFIFLLDFSIFWLFWIKLLVTCFLSTSLGILTTKLSNLWCHWCLWNFDKFFVCAYMHTKYKNRVHNFNSQRDLAPNKSKLLTLFSFVFLKHITNMLGILSAQLLSQFLAQLQFYPHQSCL